jgi:mannobiose 2-epimerase
MDAATLQQYAQRIETDLRENILAFWMTRVVDRDRGAFFGAVTNDLVVDRQAERGALLTCRILWTFSAAYRRFHDPAYLAMAERAYADLTTTFADRDHGGFIWSVGADGKVLRDRKQVYGQAFAIYALTEYYMTSGVTAALHEAIAVHQLLESNARETSYGGYLEAFSRSWQPIADMRLSAVDMNEPKSQNTLLHVMEAYTNLLRAWPDEGLRTAQARLLETMLDHVLNPQNAHLGLFFANDWALRSERISYGHDIEAAWLFTQAADVLGNASLTARIHPLAVRIADVTLAQGIDADGGVYNEGSPCGLTDTNKEWWPAAEAVVGFLNAYQLGGQTAHLKAALKTWDFIDQRLIDRKHGEWFRGVTRDGKILADQLKVSFWKCPYHNGRTGLEASARLRAIAANL